MLSRLETRTDVLSAGLFLSSQELTASADPESGFFILIDLAREWRENGAKPELPGN